MTTQTCPACHAKLNVAITAPGVKTDAQGVLTAATLRCILEFMRMHPGRHGTTELLMQYDADRYKFDPVGPQLNYTSFVRALKLNGAKSWRSSSQRGVEIPVIEEDQKPASPAPSVVADQERKAYLQTLESHQLPPVVGGGITVHPPRGADREVMERVAAGLPPF